MLSGENKLNDMNICFTHLSKLSISAPPKHTDARKRMTFLVLQMSESLSFHKCSVVRYLEYSIDANNAFNLTPSYFCCRFAYLPTRGIVVEFTSHFGLPSILQILTNNDRSVFALLKLKDKCQNEYIHHKLECLE